MNRVHYFDYIEEKLAQLATRIEVSGKLNILDLHIHSEDFYMHFLNKLHGWQLENINVFKPNTEAFDLIDKENKIIVQVSSITTKDKIESALNGNLKSYLGYNFKYVSISKDATKLRKNTYSNPHNLKFDPESDIYDIVYILKKIKELEINHQKKIYIFIKQELGKDTDITKVETNLAKIIKILASENWDLISGEFQTKSFAIDRKIEYNNLDSAKIIIGDYALHSNRVDKIYEEFNKGGVNKSSSVLSSIRKMYTKSKDSLSDDDLFFDVIEQTIQIVQNSANYEPIPLEELEMCVNILVVDAFIRCKVFENPEGYNYATA